MLKWPLESMLATETTYLYSTPGLNQLSHELSTPNFVPTDVQKVIIEQALRRLDLELSFQAAKHPELIEQLNHCLTGLL